MFLFKRNSSLTSAEFNEIKEFFSETIEKMLLTKENTLNIHKKYDLVLLSAWEGKFLVMDIFQLSKFNTSSKMKIRYQNHPFYTAARALDESKETIVYLDEHEEKGLTIQTLQAFYHICYLLETFDINVVSVKEYECIW